MARIRTIKPEFFTHPSITPLSIPARLLLVSIWTQADDEGRLYDQPAKIRGLAFGEEDRVSISVLLDELVRHGRIQRYEAMGRACIRALGWRDHQYIQRKSKSTIPDPPPFTEPSVSVQGSLTEPNGARTGRVPDGLFDEFWEVFPSNRDRKAAERAFVKAIRRAPPGVIIAGAKAYRDDPRRDPAKTKYAAGWLNDDRWIPEKIVAPTPSVPEPDSGLDDSWLREENDVR